MMNKLKRFLSGIVKHFQKLDATKKYLEGKLMPRKFPASLNLSVAQIMALKALLQQVLLWPDLSSICMDHYEQEALKNLYAKLCEVDS